MAKQSGLGDRLYVGGVNVSGNIGSIQRIAGGPAALDLTDITQSAYDREGGLRDGGIDYTAWFDKAAGAAHPTLSTLPRGDAVVTYGRGALVGNDAASLVAKQVGYDPTRAADGSLSIAINSVANGYGLEWGKQLTDGVRTDTTATSPATGYDGAASTSFGGQAYLHVFGVTGTSVTVRIQDSADNSSFANIGGGGLFVASTGAEAQRVEITGTIRRYVRVITTGTFTNAQFLVNFNRNLTAVTF
jgi:hypothetical protein